MKNIIRTIYHKRGGKAREKVCFEPRIKIGDGSSVSNWRQQFVPKGGVTATARLCHPSSEWNMQETHAT